ncbi:MAG: hypothetical protein KDA44_02440 [Planctomycetales bacterium]|nr:hypothetical protein [Planctomycetales bacterium]
MDNAAHSFQIVGSDSDSDGRCPAADRTERFDGRPRPTHIPMQIHQAWDTLPPPRRWAHTMASVRRWHPDWQYKLWNRDESLAYIRERHPDLYPSFAAYNRQIMRCDVMRYALMYDQGGMYCDLDYEFIRPYDYGDAQLVLGYEMDLAWGDPLEQVASYFFASAPGHPLWRDILDELIARPPHTETYREVVNATGPGLLTRVFTANCHRYEGAVLEPRLVFSPYRIRGSREKATLLNNGQTVGIHHASGSWKERWTATYFKAKLAKRRTE